MRGKLAEEERRLVRVRQRPLPGIMALTLLLLTLPGCDKFRSKALIRTGNALYKAQQYDEALKKYLEAQQLDPGEVRLDKFVAMGYMALYNPGSTHPKDQEALQQAIEHFQKYLKARPDDEKAAKYLVTTYMNGQKYDEAIDYFKGFMETHPNDAQAVATIAMLYARKGDFENSMEWQKKRAELEPTNADVFYTMGVTCWDKSYHTVPEAMTPDKRREIIDFGMQQLQKALQLKPDYYEAMFYINLLYREQAKLETDPKKRDELVAKAVEWQQKGLELRKKVQAAQRVEAASKNPFEPQ